MSPPVSLPARHRHAIARAVMVASHGAERHDAATLATHLYAHWYTLLLRHKPTGWSGPTPFLTRLRQAMAHAARGRDPRLDLHALIDRQMMDPASGYWSARSPVASGPQVRRVYWDIVQQGAPGLVHDLIASLPSSRPWSLKVPVETTHFLRPDTLVLYLDAADWPSLRPLVRSLAVTHRGMLHPEVPPLTVWEEEGVASAADPAVAGESFGLTLCRRIAEVLCARPPHAEDPGAAETALAQTLFGGASRSGDRRRRCPKTRGHG